ncbi:MAG: hypothetical protein M0R46_06755 [Candidatus Muirbacterium halophilum]|nr:hypothetical protein [Candidatus Muirbacterium halophilum]
MKHILEFREFDNLTIEEQDIRDKAISNNTFMKAPNGKKTKLNIKNWLQVRTKNFINWFGDWLNDPENSSKIVDENGEPKIVYHGTIKEFEVFKPSRKFGGGLYFSNSNDFAKKFAGPNGHIYAVYLKIIDPNYDGFDGAGAGAIMSSNKYKDGGVFTKRQTDKYAIKGTKEYIVFEPTQIKSATYNNGDFDINNGNIYK